MGIDGFKRNKYNPRIDIIVVIHISLLSHTHVLFKKEENRL